MNPDPASSFDFDPFVAPSGSASATVTSAAISNFNTATNSSQFSDLDDFFIHGGDSGGGGTSGSKGASSNTSVNAATKPPPELSSAAASSVGALQTFLKLLFKAINFVSQISTFSYVFSKIIAQNHIIFNLTIILIHFCTKKNHA